MARKREFTFSSSEGRTKVHAVEWMPDSGEYRAILQITHGMVEFIDRYDLFAGYMTEQGFLVVGHDHVGHGASIVSPQDWGFFDEKHPSDTLVADMHTLRTMTQNAHPQLPYFMLGHSMGSYMLRKYLTIHGKGLEGAVIMGTGFVPAYATTLAKCLTRSLARIKGWRHRSSMLAALSFGKPYKKFDKSGEIPGNSWLTKDEKIVEDYYSDPRCTFTFTLNGFMGLYEAVSYSCNPRNAVKIPSTLPILMVSGEDDPVGDFGVGVRKVYDMYRNAGITDLTCTLYKDDRHEILNETDREKIYVDIRDWLVAHLPA